MCWLVQLYTRKIMKNKILASKMASNKFSITDKKGPLRIILAIGITVNLQIRKKKKLFQPVKNREKSSEAVKEKRKPIEELPLRYKIPKISDRVCDQNSSAVSANTASKVSTYIY